MKIILGVIIFVLLIGCLTVTPRLTLESVAAPYITAYGEPEKVSKTERSYGSGGRMTLVMYYWFSKGQAVTFETHEDPYRFQDWRVLATYNF